MTEQDENDESVLRTIWIPIDLLSEVEEIRRRNGTKLDSEIVRAIRLGLQQIRDLEKK